MKIKYIFLLIGCLPLLSWAEGLPIAGTWKIVSFQVIGYPAMSTDEANHWINRNLQFTENQAALYEQNGKRHECAQMRYQVSNEDAEAYFLVGYEVKPHRLGIIEDTIQLIRIQCQTASWLGGSREFIKMNAEQILANWDGIFFFLVKQAGKTALATTGEKLMLTPQSVGVLNPNSPFNKNTLTTALPQAYQIKKITQTEPEGEIVDASYEAYQKDKLMMKIYPNEARTHIAQIHIFDPKVQAPGQTHLGMSYAEVFKQEQHPIDCQAGIDERSGQTLCAFKNMDSIRYVFEPKKVTADESELSPIETLRRAPLVELIWYATPALITETEDNVDKSIPQTDDTAVDTTEVTPPLETESTSEPSELPPKIKTELNTPVTSTEATTVDLSQAILAPAAAIPANIETIYQEQDQRLNEVYSGFIKQLTQSGTDKTLTHGAPLSLTYFTAAQRQWLSYRDNNCQWYATLAKAAKANQALLACQASMTQKRADEIQTVLDILNPEPPLNEPE